MFDIRQTHMGEMQLVEIRTLSAAATNIDFENLDFNTYNYVMHMDFENLDVAARTLQLYCDSGGTLQTTGTDYYTQYMSASNAVIGGGRLNDTHVGASPAGETNTFWVFLDLTSDLFFRWISFLTYDVGATVEYRNYSGSKTTAVTTNVTKLRLHHVTASKIGANTVVRLYKIKKV